MLKVMPRYLMKLGLSMYRKREVSFLIGRILMTQLTLLVGITQRVTRGLVYRNPTPRPSILPTMKGGVDIAKGPTKRNRDSCKSPTGWRSEQPFIRDNTNVAKEN